MLARVPKGPRVPTWGTVTRAYRRRQARLPFHGSYNESGEVHSTASQPPSFRTRADVTPIALPACPLGRGQPPTPAKAAGTYDDDQTHCGTGK